MTATPTSADTMVMTRPPTLEEAISPYPIVVIDMVAQYSASKKFRNFCPRYNNNQMAY